jgi:hypothetical protein
MCTHQIEQRRVLSHGGEVKEEKEDGASWIGR